MCEILGNLIDLEKKIDHEGCFQGALLLQSTTKEGEFKAIRSNGEVCEECESGGESDTYVRIVSSAKNLRT